MLSMEDSFPHRTLKGLRVSLRFTAAQAGSEE